jgi:hypothetical protein
MAAAMDRRGSIVDRLHAADEERSIRLERRRSHYEEQMIRDSPLIPERSRRIASQGPGDRRGSVVDRLVQDGCKRQETTKEAQDRATSLEIEQLSDMFSPSIPESSREMAGQSRSTEEHVKRLSAPARRESDRTLMLSPQELERKQSILQRKPSRATIEFVQKQEADTHKRRAKVRQNEQRARQQREAENMGAVAKHGRPEWNSEVFQGSVRCSKHPSKSSIDHKLHRTEMHLLARSPRQPAAKTGTLCRARPVWLVAASS